MTTSTRIDRLVRRGARAAALLALACTVACSSSGPNAVIRDWNGDGRPDVVFDVNAGLRPGLVVYLNTSR